MQPVISALSELTSNYITYAHILLSDDLKEDLDAYVKMIEKQNPNLRIARVWHSEQRGLATARVSGWKAATADVVAILDVHIEVHEMW